MTEEQIFESAIKELSTRAGMYIGEPCLLRARMYLMGYGQALSDLGKPYPLLGWQRWIEGTFGVSHPEWGWDKILRWHYGSDQDAIRQLPELYRKFREESSKIENLSEWSKKKLKAERGSTNYAPRNSP